MRPIKIFLFLVFTFTFQANGQMNIIDLNDALSNRSVSLVDVRGNGSSTGNAVDAYLKNNTSGLIRLSSIIKDGLYFVNKNRKSQSMVALFVQGIDGYIRIGNEKFIELPANRQTAVSFFSICAEFEKDNPSYSDVLAQSTMPNQIREISKKLSSYFSNKLNNKSNSSPSISAQLALWRQQGLNRDKIDKKFKGKYNDEDWAESSKIINSVRATQSPKNSSTGIQKIISKQDAARQNNKKSIDLAPIYVAISNVNLRTGASTTSSVILKIPKTSFVRVLDYSNRDWAEVYIAGKRGYVHKSFLVSIKDLPTYVTRSNVNFREKPTTNSGVICMIPASTRITIIDSSQKEWWMVYYNFKKGYINSSLLRN